MARLTILVATAALALAASVSARAQQAPGFQLVSDTFSGSPSSSFAAPRSTLEWDAKKARWGLKLGVEHPVDRDVQLRDVAPGLYYRITPRLHIGGAVSLAPDQVSGQQRLTDPQLPAPRVRLETTFKF